jgi:hypothetical protein
MSDEDCIESELHPVGTGDVMRELAEALREFYPRPEQFSECDGGLMALARYDALTKETR